MPLSGSLRSVSLKKNKDAKSEHDANIRKPEISVVKEDEYTKSEHNTIIRHSRKESEAVDEMEAMEECEKAIEQSEQVVQSDDRLFVVFLGGLLFWTFILVFVFFIFKAILDIKPLSVRNGVLICRDAVAEVTGLIRAWRIALEEVRALIRELHELHEFREILENSPERELVGVGFYQ